MTLVLPTLATVALGTALLVPLRDDRRGRRATIFSGTTPLRPEFFGRSAAGSLAASAPEEPYKDTRLASSDGVASRDALRPSTHIQECAAIVCDPQFELTSPPASAPQCAPDEYSQRTSGSALASSHLARTTVLDPFAFLTLLTQPLVVVRNAYVRFVYGTTSASVSLEAARVATDMRSTASAPALANIEREASVIERSFASELTALLGRGAMNHDTVESRSSGPSVQTGERDERARSSEQRAFEIAKSSEFEARLKPVCEPEPKGDPNEHRIVLRSTAPPTERTIPLTRLPLRPQENEIAWIRNIEEADLDAAPSRAQRHALLERCARHAGTLSAAVLEQAYRQEDLEGRTIALRALVRHHSAHGRDVFIEALRIGSDEERALAVDGLTSLGARLELVPAFGDRVDAVAAKAALAYVGSHSRIRYRTELAPFLAEAQIDKILTLLAGIIE